MNPDEARRRWWGEALERCQQYEDPRREAVLKPVEAFDDRQAIAAFRAKCRIARLADGLGRAELYRGVLARQQLRLGDLPYCR